VPIICKEEPRIAKAAAGTKPGAPGGEQFRVRILR